MFLKGIGLSVEENLNYFGSMWEKRQFDSEVAYTIEHTYGLRGSKKDYTPYGCHKLVAMTAPSGKEIHGCPFKTFSMQKLATVLEKRMDSHQAGKVKKALVKGTMTVSTFKGLFRMPASATTRFYTQGRRPMPQLGTTPMPTSNTLTSTIKRTRVK